MVLRRGLAVFVMMGLLVLMGGLAGTASAAPSPSGAPALSIAGAQGVVRAGGYTPIAIGGYDSASDLSVIVGLLSTSGDGHPQRAFFFHRGQFVGNDAPQPSATIRWIWSTDNVVALSYDLYRPGDPQCCPTAGGAIVRYQWNGSQVVPLDPIPTAATTAAASRR